MRSSWIENLCYGQRPLEFLRQEFTFTAQQERTTLRIFILLMLMALIAEITRIPSLRTTAFFIAILLPQSVTTTRMALDATMLYVTLMLVAIFLGLVTVILWQDQGWFRLPFAIGLIVLLMYHARRTRIPNMAPTFYAAIVLYNTQNPIADVDQALWMVVIMIGAILLTNLMIAFVLWPQSALETLRDRVRLRLNAIETLLDQLCAIPIGALPSADQPQTPHLPGWTAESFKHLTDAIRDQPHFRRRKSYWMESLMEIDNLYGGLTDYQGLWLKAAHPQPLSHDEHRFLVKLRDRFLEVQRLFKARGQTRPDPELIAQTAVETHNLPQILVRQDLAVTRLIQSMDGIYHGEPDAPSDRYPESPNTLPDWLRLGYWEDSPKILLWSLKVGIACTLVTLIVLSMDANVVDTAILTTLIVADSTLGADVRKSIMRISGALIGAVLGYLWLILGQPLADTIAGFLVTLIPFLYLCARVGATSPRLNYAGLQVGLAFSMIVFAEFEPGTYLGTGWYRVLGILLGITIMGVVDYLLWPAKSIAMARIRILQTFERLRDDLRKRPNESDLNRDISVERLRMMDSNLKDAAYFLDFARMEPGSGQPESAHEVNEMAALIQAVTRFSKIIESRHQLMLARDRQIQQGILDPIQIALKAAYADENEAIVRALEKGTAVQGESRLEDELRRLRRALEALEAFQALPEVERRYLETQIDLEQKNIAALLEIRRLIDEAALKPDFALAASRL